jgi:rod shape-determining protein MreC
MSRSISLSNEEDPSLFKHNTVVAWRFVVLFILSIILMMYDHRSNKAAAFRSAVMSIVAPAQFSISKPIEYFAWVKSSFTTHQQLTEENTHLKSELLLQKAELQKILALEKENKQLRALLRSSSAVQGTVKAAKILAISLDPFLAQVILDKGENYGVYVGQPVLDSTGIMGQAIQVGRLTSRVMLVSDSRSAIPVQDVRTGVRGIAIGRGPSEPLMLINVPQTSDIQVGDQLTTSGLCLNFPEGYPVGTIIKIEKQPGQYFATVEIKPAANLEKSRQVLLVIQKQGDELKEARQSIDEMSKENAESQGLSQTLSNTNL